MRIRIAKKQDARGLYEIRNHPSVRNNSLDNNIINFSDHKKWFEIKYFSGLENVCYVATSGKKIAGYCRFDLNQEIYFVSIAVHPDYHGQGIGGHLLGETLKRFKTDKDIVAEIKPENMASLKLFKKNNFKIAKKIKNHYFLKHIHKSNYV